MGNVGVGELQRLRHKQNDVSEEDDVCRRQKRKVQTVYRTVKMIEAATSTLIGR